MNNLLSVVVLPFETGREVDMLLFPKVLLDDLEKAVWECEPRLPKPATEVPLPKAGAPGAPKEPAAMEVGNPENPGDPKPVAAGLLKENEAADVIAGFPNPNAGTEVVMAELAEGAAPNAGVFPNIGGLPEGAELGLKLKF